MLSALTVLNHTEPHGLMMNMYALAGLIYAEYARRRKPAVPLETGNGPEILGHGAINGNIHT